MYFPAQETANQLWTGTARHHRSATLWRVFYPSAIKCLCGVAVTGRTPDFVTEDCQTLTAGASMIYQEAEGSTPFPIEKGRKEGAEVFQTCPSRRRPGTEPGHAPKITSL